MHIGLRSVVVLAVALAASPASGAGTAAFKNKVCSLVPAKDITAITGVSSNCTEQAPLPGPGDKIYVGNWKGLTPTSPNLQITIEAFSDSGMLKLAQHNLKQGLVAAPKPLKGIGDMTAYQAKGAYAVDIQFTVGKYVAIVVLSSVQKPPSSTAVITPLAKAVAAAL